MTVPGREHRGGTRVVQRRVVLGRDHPADHDGMSRVGRGAPQRLLGSGTSVRCPAASDDGPTMASASTALTGDLLGVWNSGPDVDVPAEILPNAEGDDLLAAVVSVLAHLGQQDRGRRPVNGLERLDRA